MNAYRVALILCRAVAGALWWSAGIRLLSLAITALVSFLNLGGLRNVPVLQLSVPSVLSQIPLVIAAGFLQIFAASLATSMTGGASFEGESIASSRALDAPEKSLGNAGAGLFLLFFGATNALPALLSIGYGLFFGGFGNGVSTMLTVYNLMVNMVPAFIQCIVGFMLAFMLGLRRMLKPQS